MTSSTNALPVAVIGAGIAGLTAAHFLQRNGVPVVLFEAGPQIAGMARSFADDEGFSHDFGAHFITNRLAAAIGIGARCQDVSYYGESVSVAGSVYGYPFGLLKVPRYFRGGLQAALGSRRSEIRSAADLFRVRYGHALANEVALPLLEAWSGVSAMQLAPSAGAKLKHGVLYTMCLKLAARERGRAVAIGYSHEAPENPGIWHVYPRGGVATLCERLADDLRTAIELESPVEKIYVEAERVCGIRVHGRDREVAAAISTAPCPILAKLVVGSDRLQPLARFRYRPMVFVNLRFKMRPILPDTVLWLPERRFPFFRLTEATWSMPWTAPVGKTLITADIGCEVGDSIWTMPEEALGELCLQGLEALYPGVRQHFLGCRVLRTPIAYPVYHQDYEEDRLRFELGTGIDGLYSIGRNGEFAHILMEDVYWRTLRRMNQLIAQAASSGRAAPREQLRA